MAMTGGTARLVKTTYPFSDSSKAVKLYIYYKTVQDVVNNKSTIYCGMYVTTPSGWDIGQWDDWDAKSYVGTTDNTFDGTVPNFSGTRWIAENKKFTVNHNADGSGKATIKWKWNVNSPWVSYVYPSGSFEITLPNIARVTTPTLSVTSVQMGNNVTITLNRASSSYTHDLTYTIGSTTGTIATGAATSYKWNVPTSLAAAIKNSTVGSLTITCVTKNGSTKVGTTTAKLTVRVPDATTPTSAATGALVMGSSYLISLPKKASSFTHDLSYSMGNASGTIVEGTEGAYLWDIPLSLAKQIPNATSGKVTMTCVTKNGTATVGTTTAVFTLSVPDNDETKPEFGAILTPVHELPAKFKGMYVQGKSAVRVTFEAESEYSNIKSYSVKIGSASKVSTTPAVSLDVNTSGSVTVTLTVTDARGYKRSRTNTIVVYPYSKPKLVPVSGESSVVCTRSFSDGTPSNKGEFVLAKAKVSYSSVFDKNGCLMYYRYKEASADDYTMSWTLIDGTEISSVLDGVFDTKKAYTVQLYAVDDVGEKTTASFSIPALRTPLHLGEGGRNLGLGQFCDYSEPDRIDIGWTAHFNTGIGLKVIFEDESGWKKGTVLNSSFPEADTLCVMDYTVFLAIVKSSSTNALPVLCARAGSKIVGSLETIQMSYSEADDTLTLVNIASTPTSEAQYITALYALI